MTEHVINITVDPPITTVIGLSPQPVIDITIQPPIVTNIQLAIMKAKDGVDGEMVTLSNKADNALTILEDGLYAPLPQLTTNQW